MIPYPHQATDRSAVLYLADLTADLAPATGVLAASWPTLTYHAPGAAGVAIPLSDKAAVTDPHADGALLELGNGLYRLDLPDAVFATNDAEIVVTGADASYQAYTYGGPISVRSANPLDAIALADPGGLPSNLTEGLALLVQRMRGRVRLNATLNRLEWYAADGVTLLFTQPVVSQATADSEVGALALPA